MLTFLVLAALVQADPSGDAHGAGDLIPPTAAIFSSSAPFDLTEVAVLDRDVLTLRVRLADRSNPGGLRNGITLPVIDLYVDVEPGGEGETLPGPNVRMPDGQGWEIAVRVTGDRAYARRAGDASAVEHAVSVVAEDDALTITTPFASPERARLQAVTGVYDPFGALAWRPLAREPSPWSFSSPDPGVPVVDVLAADDAAQRAALQSGVLPAGRTRDPAAPWLVLMILGLVIAATGLLLRSRIGRGVPEPRPAGGERVTVLPTERIEPAEADDEVVTSLARHRNAAAEETARTAWRDAHPSGSFPALHEADLYEVGNDEDVPADSPDASGVEAEEDVPEVGDGAGDEAEDQARGGAGDEARDGTEDDALDADTDPDSARSGAQGAVGDVDPDEDDRRRADYVRADGDGEG